VAATTGWGGGGTPPRGWSVESRGVVAIATAATIASALLVVDARWSLAAFAVPFVLLLAQRCQRDATTVLTVVAAALFLIPSGLVVGPLGAAGRPAMLLGLLCLWWWVHDRMLIDGPGARGLQPVRVAGVVFVLSVAASYAAAFVRPIDDVEASSADRAVLVVLGLVGVLFLAADGLLSRHRLDVLVARVCTLAAGIAAIGIMQFVLGWDLSGLFRLPFLTEHGDLLEVQERSDFRRVASTAAHPIEFGVVLSMTLPLALHRALHTRRPAAWATVALIAAAIPMSISRAGTLALAIAFVTMWASWPGRLRVRAAVTALAFGVVMRVLVPGLLGTIRSLFENLLGDESVKGRTADYARVGEFITEAPLFGRGFGTFIPTRYFYLDNQYLGLLIDVGIVGTVAFVALLVVGVSVARGARRGADPETRSLGQALAAGILAAMVTAATFDLFAFSMVSSLLFLQMGCAGALWRLRRAERDARRVVVGGAAPPGLQGAAR
jgi:O-antigen ligase